MNWNVNVCVRLYEAPLLAVVNVAWAATGSFVG